MTSLPPELQYGHVVGRVILAVADSGDADAYPDAVPAKGTVTFTPKNPEIRIGEPDPVVVLKQKIVCTIDAAGYLTDPDGKRGVWLVTGVYTVSYNFTAPSLPAHDIVVGPEHTLAAPLDLTLALPPGGPVLTPSQYAELRALIDSLVLEAAGVSSVNGATGAVVLDADDVGALPSTYTPPAQSWADVTEKPETFAPTAHAASHATGGSDPIEPADIGAATAAQGAKADSAVQPADVDDVIREGDTRLTDARTPTSHSHAYADITDPPTIPGPQTLSLSGSDLSLSGGGGTVTLPSGGGGGSLPAPGGITPPVGGWIGPYAALSNAPAAMAAFNTDASPTLIYVPQTITVDQICINVDTVSAGATAKVIIYGPDANQLPGAAVLISPEIDCGTTGLKVVTIPAVTLAAGTYYARGIVSADNTTVRLRCADQRTYTNHTVTNEPNNLTAPPTGVAIKPTGTYASPGSAPVVESRFSQNVTNRVIVGLRRSA